MTALTAPDLSGVRETVTDYALGTMTDEQVLDLVATVFTLCDLIEFQHRKIVELIAIHDETMTLLGVEA